MASTRPGDTVATPAHTPGPWTYDESIRGRIAINAPGVSVAAIPHLDAEAIADARLIAAAPDLLAALVYTTETLSAEGYDVSVMRAAIAKAQGVNHG